LLEKLKICLMLLKRISFVIDYSKFSIFVCTLIEKPLDFFSISLELMTDSVQSIPADCMQNSGQKVFNRGLYICAGRVDILIFDNYTNL